MRRVRQACNWLGMWLTYYALAIGEWEYRQVHRIRENYQCRKFRRCMKTLDGGLVELWKERENTDG